jgi:predicted double-glycine peptidase
VAAVLFAILLAGPGFLYVFYYFHLFDKAEWFYNFRAMSYTELLAGGMGFLFGWTYPTMEPDTFGERALIPGILFVLVFIPFMKPVLSPIDLDRLKSECPGDVCLQSSESSCGPASAATLLRNLGMQASERELARESFTYRGGTENWYLARALRNRGLNARVTVREVNTGSLRALSVAGVILQGGEGHFVAVLSDDSETVTLVDPLSGKMMIKKSELAKRYRFTGFFLVVSRN